ncbi:hypothetical protein CAEBREN_10898 [Caenorhabditis brenneri]|uniref:Uncharacterized protein n=1 Tax=Caenorhabditis brenneri TaxID=135651 RepID=G0PJD3_CAEBE|nr:hypothetical protein CAEBREN_10898 [Caenorhabditis brenneri]
MSFPGNQQEGNNRIYRKDAYDILLEYIPTMQTVAPTEKLDQNYMFLFSKLIPADWRCQESILIENIRNLYGDSNKRIQMYGSPESLERCLMIFMSFPGNQLVFQPKDYDFHKTFLPVYQSLRGNNYIYRKDVYDVLLEYIPTIHTIPSIETLAQTVGVYEEFKQKLVKRRIHREVMMRSGGWEKHGVDFSLDQENSVQLLDTIAKFFDTIEAKIGRNMQEKITIVTSDFPVHENVFEYKKMLIWLDLTTESCEL